MRQIYLILFLSIFFNEHILAQNAQDRQIEIIIEAAAENLPDDYDYAELVNQLQQYRLHPLNLNKATTTQLQDLLFLSALQISAIQEHIKANGKLISLLELQNIDLFDQQTIGRLLPFVTINTELDFNAVNLKNIFRFGKHDLILRYGQVLQDQKGFLIPQDSKLSHYTGNPEKLLTRYKFNFQNRILFSLNMEKDAGEQFFAGKNSNGFDFYSGSLAFKNFGPVNKLVIGDYALQFGQGLSLFTGFGFGKNADATLIPKVSRGLTPYSSTNEILFFRGIAATLKWKSLEFTPFISDQPIDATVQNSSNPEYISSLGTTGYHRTATEITNKNSVQQLTYGANINYNYRTLKVGLLGYATNFQYPIQRRRNTYNEFIFAGKELDNFSFYYDYNYHNFYFFGETAKSLGGGAATVNGLLSAVSQNISLVLLYRNYSRNYHSFYNQAISEGTEAVNERGIYSGLNMKFLKHWNLSCYADLFHFPWLRFQVSQPNSSGHELLSRLTYSPTNRVTAYLNYRLKQKQQNNDNAKIKALDKVNYQDLRLDISYPFSKNITLRNRAEVVKYQKGIPAAEYGLMTYQDIIYRPKSSKISGNFRLAYFKTASYDSRIYSFENDVLYSYTILPLQHTGFRSYVNAQYNLKKGLDLWFRYSTYLYRGEETVGSGLDVIEGNKKSEVRLQMRYRF
ncbi:MAG: ComEA family DNA-binding protein [Janthinobacterium lividum]